MKKPHYVIPLIRKPKRKLVHMQFRATLISWCECCAFWSSFQGDITCSNLGQRTLQVLHIWPIDLPDDLKRSQFTDSWLCPPAVPVHAAEWDNVPGFQPTIPGSNLNESYVNLNKSTSILVDSPIIHWLFSTYELELGMHIQVDKPQKQPKPLGMVLLHIDGYSWSYPD